MFTSFESLYSASLALNNMGVALLERGCSKEASETFSDALILARELTSTSETAQMATSSVQAKLSNASASLSRFWTIGEKASDSFYSNFYTVNLEDCDRALARALHAPSLVRKEAFLVRIERAAKSLTNKQDYYAALESALILYNCSNAQLMLASSSSSPSEAHAQVTSSLRVLQLSLSLIETMASMDNQDYNEGFSTPEYSSLAILILHRLIHVTAELQMWEEHQHYLLLTLHLQARFLQVNDVQSCPLPNTASAA